MRVYRGIPAHADSPLALTIGNFDGVHLGHRAMLARLNEAGARRSLLPAVMTFDPLPQEFFAPDQAPPRLNSLREKLQLLWEQGTERVYLQRFDYRLAQMPAEEFVERVLVQRLKMKWLLVGDDFRFGARRAGDFAMLSAMAPSFEFEVEAMHSVVVGGERVSSTAIRNRLEAGDLGGAKALLGRDYTISGRVVRGDALGTRLGYPTANVRLNRVRPALSGIFVVEVEGLESRALPGVASIGLRPTVKQSGAPTLEVHLFDFDRRIYGRRICVRFLQKLRDEERYPSLDELVKQIARDAATARAFFSLRMQAVN